MNMWESFVIGLAPDHLPALVAAALLPLLIWAARRSGLDARVTAAGPVGPVDRWAAALLAFAAVVHLALPLGHSDSKLLVIGFLGSGIGYAWLAFRALRGRSYRLASAVLVIATLVAYLVVVFGGEAPDQVGIATAVVELGVLALCLVPARPTGRPRRFVRLVGSSAIVAVTVLAGSAIWVGSFRAHQAESPAHGHDHDPTSRAQAGIVTGWLSADPPTRAQQRAAADLATRTIAATARYANLSVALGDGFRPGQVFAGYDVHLENHADVGYILDPAHPQALVYAITNGRATLLGALFQMPYAGRPGPTPGGPLTSWHAHNVCLSALPPGLGVVSPFAGCPPLSVDTTTPEMMHIWVVANPGGPYAQGLDTAWVRRYHAIHSLPAPASWPRS
jgi:hypothetical protein